MMSDSPNFPDRKEGFHEVPFSIRTVIQCLNVFYRVFRSLQFFQTVDQLMIRIMPDSHSLSSIITASSPSAHAGHSIPEISGFPVLAKLTHAWTNLLLQPICFLTAIAHRNLIDIMKDKRNFRTVPCNFFHRTSGIHR